MKNPLSFPELLQAFFTQRLMHQRQASPHTIASYRDTFRLLLTYAQAKLGKQPTQLAIASDMYMGWPTSLQLPDGSIITSYARSAYLEHTVGMALSNPDFTWSRHEDQVAEVVQFYIRDTVSSVARRVKELKGFERIRLKPGEKRGETLFLLKKNYVF